MANPNDSPRIIVQFDLLASINNPVTGFKMFPNPTNGDLTIAGGQGKEVSVFNAIGQTMVTLTLTNEEQTIDLKSLKTGIYMVRLTESGQVISTKKLIKQ